MRAADLAIDAPVQALVDALNSLEGIYTISSCGGHDEITHVSQLPAGSFYVDFACDDSAEAWIALACVVEAAQGFENVTVEAWFDGCLRFDLRGEGDPDELARVISQPAMERVSLTLCHDCGIDAWWFEEDGGIVHEDFYVRNDLWQSVCPDARIEGFVLCIGCFEQRLGRKLVRHDFTTPPNDLFSIPPSARFLERYG